MTRSRSETSMTRTTAFALSFLILGCATPALAQLNTQHLKGSAGLKAGSQPPPGGYVVAPALYFYSTDEVRDRSGNKVELIDASVTVAMFGAGYAHVTT